MIFPNFKTHIPSNQEPPVLACTCAPRLIYRVTHHSKGLTSKKESLDTRLVKDGEAINGILYRLCSQQGSSVHTNMAPFPKSYG